ncbi:GntR family transcriptional regulator [Ammoniphilus resinae]|uniref:DNA-binding GntR family transcriptional regulator n=1 Tax=Ammoniphilus resinae TaxID=861532 RepID=A0ABS4GTF7_9BACL|nr:GntR family transcriptional regulator [Ammoniphilus resinae]MBP1933560.1 DNA-binding GntR family transcriptional regulator [Ammoniphilus resinae]
MQPVTLKEKAYYEIRKLILNGVLKPGEFLTERELVERLKMSRTPIRSAMERLEAEGLINNSPNKGPIVAEISLKRAVDIYDFRIALESHVVKKLAVTQWDEESYRRLTDNLAEQKRFLDEKNDVEFTKKDAEFHQELAAIYGNEEIIEMMEKIQDRLQLLALRVFRKDSLRLQRYYDDHVEILELISKGSGEEASRKMIQHLEIGKGILISI